MPPAQQPQMSHEQLMAHQDQIIRQQDQSLDALSRSVATLGNLGREIHGEIRGQTALLNDLERGVDQTRDALVSQNSRLKRLLKRTKDNWLFFAISERSRRTQRLAPLRSACPRGPGPDRASSPAVRSSPDRCARRPAVLCH